MKLCCLLLVAAWLTTGCEVVTVNGSGDRTVIKNDGTGTVIQITQSSEHSRLDFSSEGL